MASDASGARHDGVRIVRAKGVRRDVWGVAVVGLGVVAGFLILRSGEPPSAASDPRPATSVPRPVAEKPNDAAPPSATPDETTPSLPTTMPHGQGAKLRALRAMGVTPRRGPDGKRTLDAGPVIDALNRAGIHDGIAVFPPPGTNPPHSGVIVPDDWELPEGYVRHYQTTDDGQPLPPILMFHPDYTFTDEQGNPIAIPEDRVVPPELVPPGFPVRTLEIPSRDRSR